MQKARRGRPPIHKAKLAALKRGKTAFFDGASQDSIKAIACRLGKSLGRSFTTSGVNQGVLVERTE